jgi:hypothetical protein
MERCNSTHEQAAAFARPKYIGDVEKCEEIRCKCAVFFSYGEGIIFMRIGTNQP